MNDRQLREAILAATRDRDVRVLRPMVEGDYVTHIGLAASDLRQVQRALEYLSEKRLIRMVLAADNLRVVVAITAEGIDALERSSGAGDPQPGSAHFHGPVGSVQIGNLNTANVNQNIGSDIAQLVEALVALREQTEDDPQWSAIHALADQAIDEASKQRTITERLLGYMSGIGQLVQSTGAMVPAYQVVYAIATSLNIHGLPAPSRP